MTPRHILPFLILMLVAVHTGHTQGLILDDARYARLPRQPTYGDGGKSEATALEGISKIDLRPFCPRPKSQGEISSCTGWATGYGALSIAFAIQHNWEGEQKMITDSAFSALFLYNQIREDFENCKQGSHIDEALDLLEKTGNVQAYDFDVRPNNCQRVPTDVEIQTAGRYRIKDWMTLFGAEDPARVKIDKTKIALASRKPVIIAMRLRNNFSKLTTDNKYWLPMLGDTAISSPHAMVVVGFDDGKQAFELMNSWGPWWGNGGFCWVKYDDFAQHARYAFEMTLSSPVKTRPTIAKPTDPPVQAAKTLFGTVTVRVPGVGPRQFEEARFSLQNGVYKLAGEPTGWPVGKLYQLLLSNTIGGGYVYAFSFDAGANIHVHWPRDSKFDEKFDGLNESAVITNSSVKIVIPGENRGLVLEKPGTEYICLLFCRDPLKDFNALLQQIKTESTGNTFPAGVQKVLGARQIAKKDLKFSATAVQFETTAVKGAIVPVILEIPVRTP